MPTLSTLLLAHDVLTPRELRVALQRQELQGADLVTNVLDVTSASEPKLLGILSEYTGLQAAPQGALPSLPADLARLIPLEQADRHQIAPLSLDGQTLHVAVCDVLSAGVRRELERTLGLSLAPCVALPPRVRKAIAQAWRKPLEPRDARILGKLDGVLVGGTISVVDPNAPLLQPEPESHSEDSFQWSQPQPGGTADCGMVPQASGRLHTPRVISPGAAHAALRAATHHTEVLRAFFEFAEQFFDYTALFAVHGDLAEGLHASGEPDTSASVRGVGVPLEIPSLLATAREHCAPLVCVLSDSGVDQAIRQDLGREMRAEVLVLPIAIRSRVVALLLGDAGESPVEIGTLGELLSTVPVVSAALEELVIKKKRVRSHKAETGQPIDQVPKTKPLFQPSGSLDQSSVPAPTMQNVQQATSARKRTDPLMATVQPDGVQQAGPKISRPPPGPIHLSPSPVPAHAGPPLPPAPINGLEFDDFAKSVQPPTSVEKAPGPLTHAVVELEHPRITNLQQPATSTSPGEPTVESLSVSSADATPVPSNSPKPTVGVTKAPRPSHRPSALIDELADSGAPAAAKEIVPGASHYAAADSSSLSADDTTALIAQMAQSPSLPANVSDVDARATAVAIGAISRGPSQVPRSAVPNDFGLPLVMIDLEGEADELLRQLISDCDDTKAPRKSEAQIAKKLAQLVGMGDHAASAVAKRFPGPVTVGLLDLGLRFGSAASWGPVLAASMALGSLMNSHLLGLLTTADPLVRGWAVIVLVEIGTNTALGDTIVGCLLDEDRTVRLAAGRAARIAGRDVLLAHAIQDALYEVAVDLKPDVSTRVYAVAGMAAMCDPRVVAWLIDLLADPDQPVRASAYDGLCAITLQKFGESFDDWQPWWKTNRSRDRFDWLVDALDSDDSNVRGQAGSELKAITGESFGYVADVSAADRQAVQKSYQEWKVENRKLSR